MSNEVEKIYVLKLFLQNIFKGCIVGGRRWNGLTSLFFFTGKNLLYFLMLNSHSFLTLQKQPPEVFYKKSVLEISQNSQDNFFYEALLVAASVMLF